MNNAYEAYASNPRYSEGGLEAAQERESLDKAREIDRQTAVQTELDEIKPAEKPISEEKPDPREEMHGAVKAIAETAVRGTQNVAGGLAGAIENTLELAVGKENIDQANEWMEREMPDWYNAMVQEMQPRDNVDKITQEMTKFIAPFGLYMKGAKAVSVASGVKTSTTFNAVLAEIITSGTAIDPHMERLSSLVKEMGVDNLFIDWLADNQNETDSEGRLKNIIENTGITSTLALAFHSAAMTMKALQRFKRFNTPKTTEIGRPVTPDDLKGQTGPAPSDGALLDAPDVPRGTGLPTGPEVPGLPTQYQFRDSAVKLQRETDLGRAKRIMQGDEAIDENAVNFGMPDAPKRLQEGDPLLQSRVGDKSPERLAIRENIVNERLAQGVTVTDRNPVAYVMGGGGASGKGTIVKMLRQEGHIPDKGVVEINPDDIKEAIPEYKQIIEAGDGRAAEITHEESSDLAKKLQAEAITKKTDILLDVTLGDKTKGITKIQELKSAGYEVRLIGVTVDPEEAVKRAVTRGLASYRFVPGGDMLAAHKGFSGAFEDYAKLVDEALLFDNNADIPVHIAMSGKGGKLEILDDSLYTRFHDKEVINEQAKTIKEIGQGQGGSVLARNGGQSKKGAGGGAEQEAAANPGGVSSERLLDAKKWAGAGKIKGSRFDFIKAKTPDETHQVVNKKGKKVASFFYDDGPDAFVLLEGKKPEQYFTELSDLIDHFEGGLL